MIAVGLSAGVGEVGALKVGGQVVQAVPPAAPAAARIGQQLTAVLPAQAAPGERVGTDAEELGQIIVPNPRLLGAIQ
jgi:hypothetical protein